MDNVFLYTQKPKLKFIGKGSLRIYSNEALFYEDPKNPSTTIFARMNMPIVRSITMDHVHVFGFEPKGFDRHGVQKFSYQEWIVKYIQ